MMARLSKFLVILIIVNMLLPMLVRAYMTDMSLYFNGQRFYDSYALQQSDGKYFFDGYYLEKYDFDYFEGDGEIIINRYCTELKITFGSDTVLINGKSQLFTQPVYRTSKENYICLELLASVFGSNMTIDEAVRRIDVTLSQKPVLPLEKTLNGKITLPNGAVAPSSGMVFKVVVDTVRGDVYSNNFKYVMIAEGQNSSNYSIKINDNLDYAEYAVCYELLDDYNFPNYSQYGYYTYYGTKSNRNNSTQKIIIEDNTQVDLNVVAKTKVTGTLNKNGYKGDLYISAYDEQRSYYDSFYLGYYDNSEFEIYAPSDVNKVYLEYYLYDNEIGYMKQGYYAKDGTVPFSSLKEYIDLNNDDLNNIQMDILKGRTISGTISYSENLTDAKDYLSIGAEMGDLGEIYTNTSKSLGSNKVNYFINVPLYGDNKYTLRIYSNYANGYIDLNGGFTQEKEQAMQFDVTDGNVEGANVSIAQSEINGTIYLPDNMVAEEDVEVAVFNEYQDCYLTIPAGASSCEYSLFTPADRSFRVGFKVINQPKFLGGYYSVNGTVLDYSGADIISITGQDLSGINMKMLLAPSISGIIKLPEGVSVPSEGININISTEYSRSVTVNIPQGETQVPYTIYLPSGGLSRSILRYTLQNEAENLWNFGYYTPNGTSVQRYYFDLQNGSANNMDITLMKKLELTGTVKLPGDKTAINDIKGSAYASMVFKPTMFNIISNVVENTSSEAEVSVSESKSSGSSGGGSSSISVPVGSLLISAGQNSGTYYTYMPDDVFMTGYKLSCSIDDSNEYYFHSFFSESGSTSDWSKATVLPKTANNTLITLIDQYTVSGVVTKPQELNAKVDIYLCVYDQNGNSISMQSLIFDNINIAIPYSVKVPADISKYNIGYICGGIEYGNSMLLDMGYYKGGNIVADIWQADLFDSVADVENINFTLPTIQPISGQEIQIVYMFDIYGNGYDVHYSMNNKQFSVPLNNASNSVVNGKIYVSLMDENNIVLSVATADIDMQPWSSETKYMQFENAPPENTRKVKIMVWDSALKPFNLPFNRTFY